MTWHSCVHWELGIGNFRLRISDFLRYSSFVNRRSVFPSPGFLQFVWGFILTQRRGERGDFRFRISDWGFGINEVNRDLECKG